MTVTIPTMLSQLVKGDRTIPVEADTVRGALDALFVLHPELRVHVLDESRSIRPNVACFHNDDRVHVLDAPVQDGDGILVLQAVSGGSH